MAMDKKFYNLLGVESNVSSAEIREEYRRLQPDTNELINEAYYILRDPEQRRLYDIHGDAKEVEVDGSSDGSIEHQQHFTITVPMEDTYVGFARTLRIKRFIQYAMVCNGKCVTCDDCHGSSVNCIRLPYIVAFEAGVPSQYTQEYFLSHDHDDRYAPTRISIIVIELTHDKFKRFGNDLVMEMDLDFMKEASAGFTKVITTIDNREVFIRKELQGTADFEKMVVRREGFAHFRNEAKDRGDLILFFRIKPFEASPPRLNDALIGLLEKMIPPSEHRRISAAVELIVAQETASLQARPPSRIIAAENIFVAVELTEEEKRASRRRRYLPSVSAEHLFYEYKKYFPEAEA